MKTTLLKVLILVLLFGCNSNTGNQNSNENKSPLAKNQSPKSEADHIKDSLVIPALDALSYQLEKSGYDAYVLNKLNSFLRETSISDFLKNNPTLKVIEKVLESGNNQANRDQGRQEQRKPDINQAQEVFETF